MRFLIDANLPRAVGVLIRSLGHEATDVRDVGLDAARDEDIAVYARDRKLCLLTGDFDFADIRSYPPQEWAGIVVLALPDDANREVILRMVEAFLAQSEVLARLDGRLAIVDRARIRLRPA